MIPLYVPPTLYVTWQDHESRAIFVVGRFIKLPGELEEYEYAYAEGSRRAEAVGLKGPKNPKALQLFGQGSLPLGWVPDYLVDELTHAMSTDASTVVVVERINPPPTPYQHRLLCRWSTSATGVPYFDPMREARSPTAVNLRGLASTGTEG